MMVVPRFPSIGDIVDLPEYVRMNAYDHPRSPYSWIMDNGSIYIFHGGIWRYAGSNHTTAYHDYMISMGLEP